MRVNASAVVVITVFLSLNLLLATRAPAAPAATAPLSVPALVALPMRGEVTPDRPLVYVHPDGRKGWFAKGLRREHDGSADWRAYHGIQFDVEVPGDRPVELTATLRVPPEPARAALVQETKATVTVIGPGVRRVVLPWSAFDFRQSQPAFLKFIKQVELSTKGGAISVRSARVARGAAIAAEAEVRGKSAPAGGEVTYAARVSNCTDAPQAVALSLERAGWEAMEASVEPPSLQLAPGASAEVKVRVKVSPRVTPGGHEKQVLRATANGDAASAARITFLTAAALPHPYVLHTPQRWREVKEKVATHDWAKRAQADYVARADKWDVPEVAKAPNLTGVDDFGPFLFQTSIEHDLMAAGIAYQLTGDKKHADKVRAFMLRLSDPSDGYPATLRGCNQSLVQEGHFFQHIAMAYDMALPAGVFTDADKAQVERTFRLLIETMEFETSQGAINNWNLSELTGALYCALVLQDLSVADRFFRGPAGAIDQLAHGTLNDGWWYECSISYNVWCTTEFTQIALAMEPWGVNFKDMRVAVGFSTHYSLRPFDRVDGLYGMSFQKWGPVTHNYVDIKRMWDALPPFVDYRGVMFGVNDATERPVGGSAYEIAYYVYRDPAYAALIKQGGGKRDLLYGVPELPEKTPERFADSGFADNVGVAMLRSRADGRPPRERIQAVLHYGTHGGFHGHFDRTNLLHLSRYGRSFYNPEMVWYSYAPFMYKFYVQNSTSKNMVVVDRKMQEPVESRRLLWHTGKLFQATAVETRARWSTPPYGGMVYPEQGYKTLHEKAFAEGRHLPVPERMPEYGSVTDFTEPILQRRLMVVTDDYVVLADYLKGEKPHTFESLVQMKGFKGIEAADKQLVRHDGQWDHNPILDAQFVTDCDWYAATAPAKASFEHRWGEGADNEGTRAPESEPGVLKLDVHTLWPARQELMVGTAPEMHPVEKRLFWTVRGDGATLAEGKLGAWILGKSEIDVPLEGVKQLELETRVELSKRPTIFWANARVVTRDGTEIPLSNLPVKYDNVAQPEQPGRDYAGGPIKVVGTQYDRATPGQPNDAKQPGAVRIDLSGLSAARFRATLGGDYPLGDETQRRKTYASKVTGTEARFLTIIEPHESTSLIRSARAVDADRIEVQLADGRVQVLDLKNLTGDGAALGVTLTETTNGRAGRSEATNNHSPAP